MPIGGVRWFAPEFTGRVDVQVSPMPPFRFPWCTHFVTEWPCVALRKTASGFTGRVDVQMSHMPPFRSPRRAHTHTPVRAAVGWRPSRLPRMALSMRIYPGFSQRTTADGIRIGGLVSACGRLCSAIYSRGLAAQVPAADTFIHGAWPSAAIYIVIYNVLPAVRTRVASPPAFVV